MVFNISMKKGVIWLKLEIKCQLKLPNLKKANLYLAFKPILYGLDFIFFYQNFMYKDEIFQALYFFLIKNTIF